MNIIQDLYERVLTEDHSPYEWWEKIQIDILAKTEVLTGIELKVVQTCPEVWRALRHKLGEIKDRQRRQ